MSTKLLESMLTVLTHLLHIFENAQNVSGFVAVFFCNQDLRSWIVSILQDSMPSVLLHLLQTFKFSTSFLGSWLPASQQSAIVDRSMDVSSDAFTSSVA